MKMITLLSVPLHIARPLSSPYLPEITALVLATAALLALVLARIDLACSLKHIPVPSLDSRLVHKQQAIDLAP